MMARCGSDGSIISIIILAARIQEQYPLPHHPQEHRVPVKVEKPPLALGNPPTLTMRFVSTPMRRRRQVRDRRDDEVTGFFESDEAAIKEVIDARRRNSSIV
jgi:hypothetical protein